MNEYKLFIREVRKQIAVQNMTQAAVAAWVAVLGRVREPAVLEERR